MTVTALDGTRWEVSRRADGVGILAAILFIGLSIAAWTLALVFGLPSMLALLEIVALVVLLVPVGREYVVAARNTATGELRAERIRGRRHSRRAQRALARELSGLA